MKHLITVITILFFSLGAGAQIKSAKLRASGLTCSMCSKAIYKALQKVPSVQSVDANVETSEYTIIFKPAAMVVPDEVKGAVEKAGFSVAEMEVTALLPRTDVAPDTHVNLGGATWHFINVPQQTLEGEQTFRIVDKAYLPAKEHQQLGKYTSMKCFATGMMESCCTKGTAKRVYHVTLKS